MFLSYGAREVISSPLKKICPESGFKTPTDFEKQFLGENADELVSSGALHEWSVKTLDFIKENLTK